MNPGFVFGENIKTEKIKKRSYEFSSHFKTKGFLLILLLILLTGILSARLFYLQILQGAYYRQLSDSNRIRTQVIHAPRGIIFDRNGVPLVLNIPGFRQVIKADPRSGVNKTSIIDKEKALSLIAKGDPSVEVDSLREYVYKDSLAHVLGYIGQISQSDLATNEYADYQPTDWLGKTGIEAEYEHVLRGKDGKQLIEVDAFGKKIRSMGQTDPVPGQDITLTIDAKLQQTVYDAAKNIGKGAIIVSRPDGEILAMTSRPTFDPNMFTMDSTYHISSESAYQTITAALTDLQNQPLLDRAIAGVYPPGSTFKIITAATGLEDKIINAGYSIFDTGVLTVGSFSFANWFYTEYGQKESGSINVVRALARSNDIFFYKLAELIGVDKLAVMAKQFGLGNKLGIDLPDEAKGTVPDKKWKETNINESWYLGDTYHYGIGQGYLLTTPLQVNSWTQVVANGGILYQPRLIKNTTNTTNITNNPIKRNLLSEATVSLIRQGMIDACSTGGVAWPLFGFKVKNEKLKVDGLNYTHVGSASADFRKVAVACKTGTAQHGDEKTMPHAWITLFAPAYDPQIIVTVLSESSGEGSNVAAPIAKKILEAYFGR